MPNPSGQDEARRALAEMITACIDTQRTPGVSVSATPDFWRIVIDALRAPSQDRAAEEMRERCVRAVRSGLIEAPLYVEDALCSQIEAAIRALPLPPDRKGGEDA